MVLAHSIAFLEVYSVSGDWRWLKFVPQMAMGWALGHRHGRVEEGESLRVELSGR